TSDESLADFDHAIESLAAERTNSVGVFGEFWTRRDFNTALAALRAFFRHRAPPRLRRTGGERFGRKFGTLCAESGSFVPLCSVFAELGNLPHVAKVLISCGFSRVDGGHDLLGHKFHGLAAELRIGPVLAAVKQRAEVADLIVQLQDAIDDAVHAAANHDVVK